MDNDNEYKKMIIIRKIIITIVIVLLILWLIFFINISKNNYKEEKKDEKYYDNIILLQNSARYYFTNEVILSGDTIISLKKLYEKGFIEKLTTSNGDECIDIDSFALVKQVDDKYQLDVVLVCGYNNTKVTSYYDVECGLSCDEIKP